MDDSTTAVPLAFSFPFGGTAYSSVDVSDNGFLSLGGSNGFGGWDGNAAEFLGGTPRIAVGWFDLAPLTNLGTFTYGGGDILFHSYADRAVFTWSNVPECCQDAPGNTFQVQILASGVVTFGFEAFNSQTLVAHTALLGVTPGGNAADPDASSLSGVPFSTSAATVYFLLNSANAVPMNFSLDDQNLIFSPNGTGWSVSSSQGSASDTPETNTGLLLLIGVIGVSIRAGGRFATASLVRLRLKIPIVTASRDCSTKLMYAIHNVGMRGAFLFALPVLVLVPTEARGAIAISVSPSRPVVGASQSVQFNATVSGTPSGDIAVIWSVSPSIGSISGSGLYTAPQFINQLTKVMVLATSVADPTVSAGAITLLAPVSVAISPLTASLTATQTQQLSATVTYSINSAVTWSLTPTLGVVVNGVYTAPSTINTQQSVTVTATSVADPRKSASAIITLIPVVSVTISPPSARLNLSQSQQFQAAVTGTTNPAVNWSITPVLGSVSTNGLYTSPVAMIGTNTVTVTATSVADTTKSGSATVTVTGTAPQTTITLPIEVVGPAGTVESVTVPIPLGANLSGPQKLWMQIHGLRYPDKASVQVNSSPWVSINDGTVTYLDNSLAYGGIGGGFNTHKLTVDLPPGTLVPGNNTVSFRFNRTQGGVGFRVLKFNLLQADGTKLLGPDLFVEDDPNLWQAPLTSAADIAEGKWLFQNASILHAGVPVRAHCNNCHTPDGQELKYFNYSNKFIHFGAIISGLTDLQGDQIASYIRTINVPNPGRPWNPPYQPGPGLDSQPVINWAAGAGIDAVLDNDQQLLNQVFPNGIQDSVFSASGNLNIREIAIPFQLPDWNHWMPTINPIDGFGDDFINNVYNTLYPTIRSQLNLLDPVAYSRQWENFQTWLGAYYNLHVQELQPLLADPTLWTPDMVNKTYSLPKWGMVKTWGLMNEFQLEGFAQSIFGPQADQRAWYSNLPFMTGPHMLLMPHGVVGLGSGTAASYFYDTFIWYQLQLILNNSNKQQQDWHPIDWGYSFASVKDVGMLVEPQAVNHIMWLIKGLQISHNGKGPELGTNGWQPTVNDIALLMTNEALMSYEWPGVPPSTQVALCEGMIRAWLAEVTKFTPQQFYTGGWASPTVNPVPGQPYGAFADKVWFMIPRFHYVGVNQTLVNSMADWAKTIWPNANWEATKTATCARVGWPILCSTE